MKTETIKDAGYISAKPIGNGEVILTDMYGNEELWVCNKFHASYGIKWRNTRLEFVTSQKRATA
jgi:hypothetical protein